ncbi:hypothetical protein [uncultured Pelagimonas sp.]|uniref:hypothetical protein n=1 Tax=uncultured Pelagimonas sp. TaxID=1618102 RepID=UPI002634EB3A|nr:hypothetical protein [uncultured Pelagimonas sp.]
MLKDKEKLHEQLARPVDDSVRAVYLLLAQAKLPDGLIVRPAGHGFIESELRFELDERWFFSAVLNKSWVLWYFRRPALAELAIDPEELRQIFPGAELTKKKELKLHIRNLETAYAVLGWVLQNG